VGNRAPSITSVAIEPADPRALDTLSCIYTGFSDIDEDADASEISWSINGLPVGTGPALADGFVRGDEVACVVTPHDGTDPGSPLAANVEVLNSAPSIDSVSLSPDTVLAGTDITCNWHGFVDPDGHADSSTIAWFVNDTL
jgi:hypothetical protein